MTTFDYNYQNSFRFCFVIEICQSRWGLKNNSPNLHKKTTNWRILVVVVKWRHRAIVLLCSARQKHDVWTGPETSPNQGTWLGSLVGTCLTLPNLGFLWVLFKYPKISKNGNPSFVPVKYLTGKPKNLTAKTKYLTAKLKTSRQNQILHSKSKIALVLWWVFGFAVRYLVLPLMQLESRRAVPQVSQPP